MVDEGTERTRRFDLDGWFEQSHYRFVSVHFYVGCLCPSFIFLKMGREDVTPSGSKTLRIVLASGNLSTEPGCLNAVFRQE
jgi:hypothetical protein